MHMSALVNSANIHVNSCFMLYEHCVVFDILCRPIF